MAQREHQAAVIEPQAPPDLGTRYVFRDRDRVLAYLAAHPQLVDILREADPEIAKRFGERTTVSLDVEDDPEIADEPMLFGFIRTSDSSKDALDLLQRLDSEWWISRYMDVNDHLLFSLEFG